MEVPIVSGVDFQNCGKITLLPLTGVGAHREQCGVVTSVRPSQVRLVPASAVRSQPGSPVLKAVGKPVARKPVVPTLRRGTTGAAVSALQQKLVAAKFMSLADFRSGPGVYGPRTEAAVARLQEQAGLPVTGIANAKTQAALAGGARGQPEALTMTMPLHLTAVRNRLSHAFADDVTQPIAVPLGA
ncbi:MAG: hypothetical protein DI536_03080 [Archangium gephyra]|uniref:Peptidoglycan binding-like domain-containing protein n=1 Tax=Archangium gephyra TaxID=48 RepID=A0A2W5VNH0_9BACT|nr:MAG: hypothetical protein DI536_03080 [Archangium gephyra]